MSFIIIISWNLLSFISSSTDTPHLTLATFRTHIFHLFLLLFLSDLSISFPLSFSLFPSLFENLLYDKSHLHMQQSIIFTTTTHHAKSLFFPYPE